MDRRVPAGRGRTGRAAMMARLAESMPAASTNATAATAATAPVEPFVDFNRVWLAYDDTLARQGEFAVEDLSLQAAPGEFIAIVGPSGCGKSTFMKLATGLRPATRGMVKVAGHKVSGPLKQVGMAFQAPTLLPWRTTLDNVMLPLEIVEPYRSTLRARRDEYIDRAPPAAAYRGPGRLRGQIPVAALRRHAAARVDLPRADPPAAHAAARRALRRARRLHPRRTLVRAARPVAGAALQRDPGHARPARGRVPCRHGLRDEPATRPHRDAQGDRPAAAARSGTDLYRALRRAGARAAREDRPCAPALSHH
ncbi:hypothetical protein CBM2622_A50215 [Cupriavidus taiwanensis]|nr:hypothetical protein CBM2622_A50215 [Cupriavidus taiwanensis]